jgi:hypothetical protein
MRMGDADRTAVDSSSSRCEQAELVEEMARVRAERDEAMASCRQLEHELGELRGRTKRLELSIYRRMARRQRWVRRVQRIVAWLPRRRP